MANDKISKPSPFHPGEVRLQQSLGVAERMEEFGRRVIRDFMPDQHRQFYTQLPFVVLGSVDPEGAAWVTLLTGQPGFMHSPDPRTLSFSFTSDLQDPATTHLDNRDAIGLLGIELHTRRRNRMNGTISAHQTDGFDVRVEHAFGNCPQYIQRRDYEFTREPSSVEGLPKAVITEALHERARAMIETADTFFVSSYVDDNSGRHVDASHRGGKPGFVRVNADGSLTVPDFAGNLHFNTLGNFLLNPKAGLVFSDFETGDMLHLTGRAKVILESDEIRAFQGAERIWVFHPEKLVLRPGALPLRWTSQSEGQSPNSLMTGDWEQTRKRLEAEALKSEWRPFRIAEITDESNSIRSFHLQPADGRGIVAHKAGQHLPIRVRTDQDAAPALRTYTISTAPSDGYYRISVKRQGLVSNFLHDSLSVGNVIDVRAPLGAFTIDALERRPTVLIAAGVGITPMLSMLRHIVYEGLRKRRVRTTWMFLAARSLADRAFDQEIARLVEQADGAVRLVRLLGDTTNAKEGLDYDAIGRIDVDLFRAALPFDDYDFYMCGPPVFMQGLYDQLRQIGVANARIHAEAFGPVSFIRSTDRLENAQPAASTEPVPIIFARSGKEAHWEPGTGSLLDLAEARGLTPDFSCRTGNCGVCATKIIEGKVTYDRQPQAEITENTALVCCAVPAAFNAGGTPRLILDL